MGIIWFYWQECQCNVEYDFIWLYIYLFWVIHACNCIFFDWFMYIIDSWNHSNLFIMIPKQLYFMIIHNLITFWKKTIDIFQITIKVVYGCKRAMDVRISIAGLQCMPNVLMRLEKWMIVLEKLETEERKALAMVPWWPFLMNKKCIVPTACKILRSTDGA